MSEKYIQKWAIILPISDLSEGYTFDVSDDPLHVTIAGIFTTEMNEGEIIKIIKRVIKTQKPIEVCAGNLDNFGESKDVPVVLIEYSESLWSLHSKLHVLLNDKVVFDSPQFQSEGYRAHCTIQKSGQLKKGQKVILNNVSLVDLFPNQDPFKRRIVKTIKLKDIYD